MKTPMYERGLSRELLGRRPPCFTEPQWMRWVAAEIISRDELDTSGFCGACTPAFKLEMLAAGRCVHPRTAFVESQQDGITGVRAEDDRGGAVERASYDAGKAFYVSMIPIIDALKDAESAPLKELLAAVPPGTVL